MNRLLAIDYGQKRVGIAWTDMLGLSAYPQPFLPNNDQLMPSLKQMIQTSSVGKVILGLPLTLRGTDSKMTLEVRAFGSRLEQYISVPVIFYEEGLTSDNANTFLIQANVSRQKRKTLVDSIAAAILLESFLKEHQS